MNNELTKDEKIAIGQQFVTLTNRINAQGIIIERLENDIELRDTVLITLKNDIAWIKMFIKGLPREVESDT